MTKTKPTSIQSLNPDLLETFNRAVALHEEGHYAEAETLYNELLQERQDVEVLFNLANIYYETGRLDEAEPLYRDIIKQHPDYYNGYNNLGNLLQKKELSDEAEICFRKALELNPDYTDSYYNLGNLLMLQSREKEAYDVFIKILELDPTYNRAYHNLSLIHYFQGDLETADRYARKALDSSLNSTEVYKNIVGFKKYTSPDDEDAKTLEAMLNKDDCRDHDAMHLHFSLGKIYNDCKLYDKAFEHYHEGNRLKRATLNFDIKKFTQGVDNYIKTFTPEFFEERKYYGIDSPVPVFIVGEPRSGTTLVEQIVSGHPEVYGAGELTKATELLKAHSQQSKDKRLFYNITKKASREMGQAYLDYIQKLAPEGMTHITDKIPGNIFYLGAIALLFPNAKVIHCMRDPMDTCLSCYFQLFQKQNEYTYNLAELGVHYAQYQRISNHWRNVLPLDMLEIRYEELVQDKEAGSRKLIEFLGLPWDDACLNYQINERNVRTASAWQVRQPIYTTSLNRWKHYEPHLMSLKIALGECYEGLAEDVPALIEYMKLQLTHDQLEQAQNTGKQILAQQPKHSEALALMSRICQQQQDIPQAIAYIEQAINHTPDHLPYQLELAKIYAEDRQERPCKEIAEAILTEQPHHPQCHYLLGYLAKQNEDLATAIEHFQHIIDHHPDFSPAHQILAETYTHFGQKDKAEKLLQQLASSA